MTQLDVTIAGNLISQPEFRKFDNSYLCKFRVATSRRRQTDATDHNGKPIWEDLDQLYIDVECWGQLAVNCGVSLGKGLPVLATGRLVTDEWEEDTGAGEGKRRSKIVLKAYRVAFELSRYQVSSVKTGVEGKTLDGHEPLRVRTADDMENVIDHRARPTEFPSGEADAAAGASGSGTGGERELAGVGADSGSAGASSEEGTPF